MSSRYSLEFSVTLKNAAPRYEITSVAVTEYSLSRTEASSAALPVIYAATAPPSNADAPIAQSPAVTPESTSPLPPFANAELPVQFNTTLSPSVNTLIALFNSRVTLFALANALASPILSFTISSTELPLRREN